jgi:aminoglycoside phosphotransferase (APT) family kinase protein
MITAATSTDYLTAPMLAWATKVADLVAPVHAHLIEGGRSNITLRLLDGAGRSVVLRRPPTGPTAQTAHDVAREFRFLKGLHPAGIPVPRPIALCTDREVAPCDLIVVDYVDGVTLGSSAPAKSVPSGMISTATADLADRLAQLHALDPDAVGLADVGRGGNYLERQVSRWAKQIADDQSQLASNLGQLSRKLSENLPDRAEITLIHGDYHLGNVIFAETGRVAAIIDWELATLGDPLVDLAVLLSQWPQPGATDAFGNPGFMSIESMPGAAKVIARYAATSGRDVSVLPAYLTFAHWRAACVGVGVMARYRGRQMADTTDINAMRRATEYHAARAQTLLESAKR